MRFAMDELDILANDLRSLITRYLFKCRIYILNDTLAVRYDNGLRGLLNGGDQKMLLGYIEFLCTRIGAATEIHIWGNIFGCHLFPNLAA